MLQPRTGPAEESNVKPRALLCEGDPALRALLGDRLRAHGWLASEASTAADAFDLAASLHPDLVVLDVEFAGLSGLESIPRVRAGWPGARVVALSGTGRGAELCLGVGACALVATSDLARLDEVLRSLEVDPAPGTVPPGPDRAQDRAATVAA